MSTKRRMECVISILLVLVVSGRVVAQTVELEQWKDIKLLLPATTNAILAINAEKLFQSDLAIKNDWRELHAEHFERNPTMLPPIASRFVLATELDTEHFEPQRELAVIATAVPIGFEEIRKRVDGQVDSIAGLNAIHTPRDSFVVSVNDHLVALVRSATRQWAVQQLRDGRNRTQEHLPVILTAAIDRVAQGRSQIALAVQLKDAISRSAMEATIQRSNVLGESGSKNLGSIVDEMMQLEGLTFSIDVSDDIHGRLAMVFANQPQQLSQITKPVMLELLAGAGAVLPEFKDWVAVSASNSLGLEGRLSVDGLRHVLSLLSVQPTDLQFEQQPNPPLASLPNPPQAAHERATANYIKRVTRLANTVIAAGRAGHLREQVLWTDRSAQTILRMSNQEVDYDAVKLGRQIAYGMLDVVSVYQEAEQKAQARIAAENPPAIRWHTELIPYRGFATPFGRYYRYRPFSYAQIFAAENAAHARHVIAEELGHANSEAREILSNIEANVARLNQMH